MTGHYNALLLRVSQKEAWMDWVEFFLRGVAEEGREGVRRALLTLRDKYRSHIEGSRLAAGTLSVVDFLFSVPMLSATQVRDELKISCNAVQSALNKLEAEKIVVEVSGQKRNRIYMAPEIMEVLQTEDTS